MMPEDDDDSDLIGVLILLLAPSILVWAFAIYGFMCRYIWVHP